MQKASLTTDFAKLKELFGPPPVLSSEDPKAYDAMLARIIKSLKASDFIEQMLSKDLTDVTWELKRYSRHKALVIERQYREQQEMEEELKRQRHSGLSNWKSPPKRVSRLSRQTNPP